MLQYEDNPEGDPLVDRTSAAKLHFLPVANSLTGYAINRRSDAVKMEIRRLESFRIASSSSLSWRRPQSRNLRAPLCAWTCPLLLFGFDPPFQLGKEGFRVIEGSRAGVRPGLASVSIKNHPLD